MDYFGHLENLFTENDKIIKGKQRGMVKWDEDKQSAIFTAENPLICNSLIRN